MKNKIVQIYKELVIQMGFKNYEEAANWLLGIDKKQKNIRNSVGLSRDE